MPKIIAPFAIGLSLSLLLSGALLAESMSMASSAASGAKVALQSVSKSLTAMGASTSSSSDSTNDRSDDLNEVVLQGIGQPWLVDSRPGGDLALWKHGPGISKKEWAWLQQELDELPFPLPVETVKVIRGEHHLMKRRARKVQFIGRHLYVDEGVWVEGNMAEVSRVLAKDFWKGLPENLKKRWELTAGWARHPLMPWLTRKNGLFQRQNLNAAHTAEEDFILHLLSFKKGENLNDSRQVFISQLCGENRIQKPDGKAIAQNRIYIAYVEEQGALGASQGHMALVVENNRHQKVSFAYTSDFDWQRPWLSATRSLFGRALRRLEIREYKDFVNTYAHEARSVRLVELQLSVEAKNRLLYRLLECQSTETGHYSFLRQNCANPIRDILIYAGLENEPQLARWHTPKTIYNWISQSKETEIF